MVTRAGGFLLVFLGVLIAVAAVSFPGYCIATSPPSSCGVSWLSAAASWILAAKLLLVIGLAGLGFGSAIKMHYGLKMPTSGRPEDAGFIARERSINAIMFLVSLLLLVFVLLTINVLPPLLSIP